MPETVRGCADLQRLGFLDFLPRCQFPGFVSPGGWLRRTGFLIARPLAWSWDDAFHLVNVKSFLFYLAAGVEGGSPTLRAGIQCGGSLGSHSRWGEIFSPRADCSPVKCLPGPPKALGPVLAFFFYAFMSYQNPFWACSPASQPDHCPLLEQCPSQFPASQLLLQPRSLLFRGAPSSRPALPHPHLCLSPRIPSQACGFLIPLNLLS